MATENIVMLACAAVLVTLHVLGGSLSGVGSRRRAKTDDKSKHAAPSSRSMQAAETELS